MRCDSDIIVKFLFKKSPYTLKRHTYLQTYERNEIMTEIGFKTIQGEVR